MALKRKIGITFAPYFNYWYERSVCWGKKSKGEFEAGCVIIEWGTNRGQNTFQDSLS